jgi:hypothetical protein
VNLLCRFLALFGVFMLLAVLLNMGIYGDTDRFSVWNNWDFKSAFTFYDAALSVGR